MIRLLWLVSRRVAPLLVLTVAARAAETDPIDALQGATGDWVKMRAETVRIEDEWDAEKALLVSTTAGFKDRAAKLEADRDHLRAKTADERAELDALKKKKDAGAAELTAAEARLNALDQRLAALRPKLPPRLATALELSFRSLADQNISPGERMQLTISALNRCAQFNATVSCGEEVLQLEGEPAPKAVETIYWGLSHGYALDRVSGRVWFGSPGAQAWSWMASPDAAAPVAKLIAIYYDKHDPELVAVPARLMGVEKR